MSLVLQATRAPVQPFSPTKHNDTKWLDSHYDTRQSVCQLLVLGFRPFAAIGRRNRAMTQFAKPLQNSTLGRNATLPGQQLPTQPRSGSNAGAALHPQPLRRHLPAERTVKFPSAFLPPIGTSCSPGAASDGQRRGPCKPIQHKYWRRIKYKFQTG